jgi:GxxExxY protein
MELICEDLTYKINGVCFKTHRDLGRFCRERQYGDKLEFLFKETGVDFKREYEIRDFNKSSPAGNKVDFLIESKIIPEVKAKKFITKEDYFQMLRYSEASNLQLGLIVNFRNTYLKPKRIINSKFKK